MTTCTPFRDLLHAANLHGTDGFTSPPKEGVLTIFSPWKILTASAGIEPANLGVKGQHATPRPPKPLSLVVSYGRFERNNRSHLHRSSSQMHSLWTAWALKMSSIGCDETSTLRNMPEEQISQYYSCIYWHLSGCGHKGRPFCLTLWLREPASSVPSTYTSQCSGNDFISVS